MISVSSRSLLLSEYKAVCDCACSINILSSGIRGRTIPPLPQKMFPSEALEPISMWPSKTKKGMKVAGGLKMDQPSDFKARWWLWIRWMAWAITRSLKKSKMEAKQVRILGYENTTCCCWLWILRWEARSQRMQATSQSWKGEWIPPSRYVQSLTLPHTKFTVKDHTIKLPKK